MEKEKKKFGLMLIVALIVGLLIAVFFIISTNTTYENGKHINTDVGSSVSDVVDESLTITYSFDKDGKESTVFSGLLNYGVENNVKIKYNNNYSYGVFIESIDGIKNGDDEKYWQYYIDNVLGDSAADKKILKDGAIVEWRFEEVPF
ncbi:MAG: DUF4430 domain-containing protein [Patescibacteria group bacterium]|nr:DUF4430 domain-containing protein [Patescibacteria group bacterium]